MLESSFFLKYQYNMINRKLTQKTENKVLLLSTCWYEALGISEIIKSLGYDVFFSDSNEKKFEFDFIVISLSAERLSGWARHIKMIEEICKDVSGSVLILTPECLSQYTLLKKVGYVASGESSIPTMTNTVDRFLSGECNCKEYKKLTNKQSTMFRRLLHEICFQQKIKQRLSQHDYYYQKAIIRKLGLRSKHILNLIYSLSDGKKYHFN